MPARKPDPNVKPLVHDVGKLIDEGLGCRQTILQWIHEGILPAKKLGKRFVVLDSDLQHFLQNLLAAD